MATPYLFPTLRQQIECLAADIFALRRDASCGGTAHAAPAPAGLGILSPDLGRRILQWQADHPIITWIAWGRDLAGRFHCYFATARCEWRLEGLKPMEEEMEQAGPRRGSPVSPYVGGYFRTRLFQGHTDLVTC